MSTLLLKRNVYSERVSRLCEPSCITILKLIVYEFFSLLHLYLHVINHYTENIMFNLYIIATLQNKMHAYIRVLDDLKLLH